nr:hypothetical protein [Tanacetum cinerariifolium]
MDPLKPPPPASESESKDAIEVENPIEHEDETIHASVHERLCGYEMAHALVEKKGKTKDEFYGKLILDLGNEVRSSMEKGMAAMGNLVEKLGNTEDKVECKKLKKELEEVREFMFEKRPNEAIDVPFEDVESSSLKALIMPPKSTPLTQAAIRLRIMSMMLSLLVGARS